MKRQTDQSQQINHPIAVLDDSGPAWPCLVPTPEEERELERLEQEAQKAKADQKKRATSR